MFQENQSEKISLPKNFLNLSKTSRGFLWVDFISEPPEICLPILQDFGFHHLAINDALQETHVPKLDDWGDYLYIVLNYMNAEENGEDGIPKWMNWISSWEKLYCYPPRSFRLSRR